MYSLALSGSTAEIKLSRPHFHSLSFAHTLWQCRKNFYSRIFHFSHPISTFLSLSLSLSLTRFASLALSTFSQASTTIHNCVFICYLKRINKQPSKANAIVDFRRCFSLCNSTSFSHLSLFVNQKYSISNVVDNVSLKIILQEEYKTNAWFH